MSASEIYSVLLAAAALCTALASLRTAQIAEREFRASRLPFVDIDWTSCSKGVSTVAIKNVAKEPIVLHRALIGFVSFCGASSNKRMEPSIEVTLQPEKAHYLPAFAHISDDELATAESYRLGQFVVIVDVSVLGIPEIKATWHATADLFHWLDDDADEPLAVEKNTRKRRRRSLAGADNDEGYYSKLKRLFRMLMQPWLDGWKGAPRQDRTRARDGDGRRRARGGAGRPPAR